MGKENLKNPRTIDATDPSSLPKISKVVNALQISDSLISDSLI